jgi:hypothetical protein
MIKEPLPKVEPEAVKYLWAYKKTANVRANNSASSNKVASIIDGDSVKVLKNKNGWYEVILDNGTNGWIRSDLLGTKNMSVFSKAITFSNNLKENENINLYFDKKIQHKRIFLEYPANKYSSKSIIEKETKKLGKKYQEKVYPGKVTIQVIEPEKQTEYLTISLPGSPIADINLPVFNFGILDEINIVNHNELILAITVKENIENARMLKEARKISGNFPLTFKSVNVNFIDVKKNCLLSYIEDASGENYKFNHCL